VHNRKINKIALLLSILFALQGCAALVVGAGVGVASAAHDRRTLGTQVDDKTAYSRLTTALAKSTAVKELTNINVHVYNGTALLVGQAPSDDLLRQVQELAESVKNIKKLHNQVRIGSPIAASSSTNDLWLESKIKTKLLADKRIDGLHIDVAVEDSEVFLMGIVSQSEADISVDIARNVSGVTQVIKAFEYL
jgi:osmotically-inducible protein OsmY